MDSTLLNQVRYLCRDRASYEHLKAILVQQERVHQLSWEERYEQINASSDQQNSNIFNNILVREKALAQLADAIQRSPSLDLVLQVAVQVAQKLLQVDRVAIFRCDADGRGEFTTDAIAAGLTSLADMPERQLSLSRHMVESTQAESSIQIIDSIRSSSLSSYIVNLLEQIGISSYAANKIYAGQGVWGTLVAFHSSVSHGWTESDRTSLSLVATQIGVAIALANLRLQTQQLSSDLQTLQVELNQLQQTVTDLAKHQPIRSERETSAIAEIFPEIDTEVISASVEEELANIINRSLETEEIESIETIDDHENGTNHLLAVTAEIYQNHLVESAIDHADNAMDMDMDEDDFFEEHGVSIISQALEPEMDLVESIEQETELSPEYLDCSETSIDEPQSEPPEPKVLAIARYEVKEEILASYEPQYHEIAIAEITEESATGEELSQELTDLEMEVAGLDDIDEGRNDESVDLESKVFDSSISEASADCHDPSPAEIEVEIEDIPAQPPTLPIDMLIATAEVEADSSTANMSEDILETWQGVVSTIQDLATEPVQIDHSKEAELQKVTEQMFQDPDIEDITASAQEEAEEDHDPTIELQFIETIVAIAENREQGIKVLLNVIDAYLEEAPRLVQAIDKALAVNDHLRLLQALNSLRANSDYVGAITLSYQCRQLESAVRANYVVLIYASLSQVAIEVQRATDALRLERSRYTTS
ncbi:MAG: hypothetical protein AUK48_07210 [Oscillatoriales cyanobacterium CG2_30_44_21]|nr:MAG: hypothetical protein AUK48_07210 [Oscillatoriales cyanobacterium CG2_30_44_21]